jgi:hypothetical protein
MILTIAEDFSNDVVLDAELTATSLSGLYLNSGVHSLINLNNLLSFLPRLTFVFADYVAGTTYGKYETSLKRTDIVTYSGEIYQSLTAGNIGNTPSSSPSQWLKTNIESLRIKSVYYGCVNNALTKLSLSKRLITNQYLYNIVDLNENHTPTLLPNDYSAWVFEPKGSDYVSITLNQVALQAPTATPQNLYVINQGELIDTLTLHPNADGRLEFEDLNYTFYGKGKFLFVIDSQNVLLNGSFIDLFKYDGFVAYTATGIGTSPESAKYSYSNMNNGLNFNVSCYLDPSIYIENNLLRFAPYIQKAWEMDILNRFLSNSNNRSNTDQMNALNITELKFETKDRVNGTVLNGYERELKKTMNVIDTTFDTQLLDTDDGEINVIQTTL